jgi:parallel beta-helix repeat protein
MFTKHQLGVFGTAGFLAGICLAIVPLPSCSSEATRTPDEGVVDQSRQRLVRVKDYATGDAVITTVVETTAGSAVVRLATALPSTAAGKPFFLAGAGATGKDLSGIVISVSADTATLDVNVLTAVTNTTFVTGTDALDGIQNALDAAAGIDGASVQFEPGKAYFLKSKPLGIPSQEYWASLRPKSNTRIDLNGSVLFSGNLEGRSNAIFRLDGLEGIEISNGKLLSSPTLLPTTSPDAGTPYTESFGVRISSSRQIRLSDLDVSGFWWDALALFRGAKDDAMGDASVPDEGTSDIWIERVHAHHNRRSNISVVGGSRITIRGSSLDHPGVAPDGGQDPRANINVEGEKYTPGGMLVDDGKIRNVVIADNECADGRQGIAIKQNTSVARPSGIKVSGNHVLRNDGPAVLVERVDDATIVGNLVAGVGALGDASNAKLGVSVGSSTQVNVLDNSISGYPAGIYANTAPQFAVRGNHVAGTYALGDLSSSAGAGEFSDGITVRNGMSSSDRAIVQANDVVGFRGNGIVLEKSVSTIVSANNVRNNGRSGIWVIDGIGSILENNLVSASAREPVTMTSPLYSDLFIDGASDNISVQGNVCKFHDKYMWGVAQSGTGASRIVLDPQRTVAEMRIVDMANVPVEIVTGAGAGNRAVANGYDTSAPSPSLAVMFSSPLPAQGSVYELRYQHKATAGIRIGALVGNVELAGNDLTHTEGLADARPPQDLSNMAWVPLGTVVQTSDEIREDTSTGAHKVVQSVAELRTGVAVPIRVELEASSSTRNLYVGLDLSHYVNVDLANHTVGDHAGTAGSPSAVVLPEGWVRLAATFESALTNNFGIYMVQGTDLGYTGDGVSKLRVRNIRVTQRP